MKHDGRENSRMQSLVLRRKLSRTLTTTQSLAILKAPGIEYYGGGRGNGGNVGGFYHTSALCEAHSSKPNGAQRAS
ncbi:hypothetical protein V1477_010242 [Vespula maculifrons]|uniref:Uncharacterized protein n=1 Tax=Vespula maculifrons TaxID=7453 RepID=A0ABD2C801_VESMC